MDLSPFRLSVDPATTLLGITFQAAVAMVLWRTAARRAQTRWLGALFALNAVVATLGFIADAPSSSDTIYHARWAEAATAFDAATTGLMVAFLVQRFKPDAAWWAVPAALSVAAIHVVALLVGSWWAPALLQWLRTYDIWVRASPFFAAWIVVVVTLSHGDRFDRFIALAWGARAATWGVHGPQRLWLEAQGLGSGWPVESLWITGLLVAAVYALVVQARRPGGARTAAFGILGAGFLGGLGAIAYGNTVPYALLDRFLLVYGRGLLVVVAVDPALLSRASMLTFGPAAAGTLVFHALRINFTPTDDAGLATTMAAYATWSVGACLAALATLDLRFAPAGHAPAAGTPRPPRGYALTEVLRDAGPGVTYRGRHKPSGDAVVLKFLPWGSGLGQREARALTTVQHPNIVALRDTAEVRGRLVLVMDHVEGGDLKLRLAQGPLTDAEARRLARGLLSGLAALHQADIVHGDVKPSNVLVTSDGDARLIDFGIARTPADEATLTTAVGPDALGTPQYMPPEVARGERATSPADVWGAAATLYESLVGRPYLDPRGADIVTALRRAATQRPYRADPDLPPEWNRWFRRALHPEVRKRFPDAAAALNDLPD